MADFSIVIHRKNWPVLIKIPFDYNFLFLLVEHADIVYPTTFIVKISKQRGTSANWPWGKDVGSLKTSFQNWRWLQPSNQNLFVTNLDWVDH